MAGSRKSVIRERSLEELVAQIQRVNPTGRGRRAAEEVVRYGQKARLQSLLLETHPDEVSVTLHHDMPGIVGLSVVRLHVPAGHAVVAELSARARHIVEEKIHSTETDSDEPPRHRSRRTNEPISFVQSAERYVVEYDFECALDTLREGINDSTKDKKERIDGALLMLEIYVDHLADYEAALSMEHMLQQMEKAEPADRLSPRAHELLGVAASRSDDWAQALFHLSKSYGERVGVEIAAIATKALGAKAWIHAGKAWELLNVRLSMAAPPLVGSLEALQDSLKLQFVRIARDASEMEIRADAELERIVREFAPNHPYLEERRSLERKIRSEVATRAALQKAGEARRLGRADELSEWLDSIVVESLSEAETADIAAWREWLEEQRAQAQISRVLQCSRSGEFDAAARAYVGLSKRARALWSTTERESWSALIDQLNDAFPDRKNAAILLRAAAAWASVRAVADARRAWSLLAPYQTYLAQLETCASTLHELQAAAERESESTHVAQSQIRPSNHEHDVHCNEACAVLTDVDMPESHMIVARHVVRIGSESFVMTLGRHARRETSLLSFWPCRSGTVRHWEFSSSAPMTPSGIAAHHGHLVWLSKSGGLWIANAAENSSVRCLRSERSWSTDQQPRLVILDADHCAVRGSACETNSSWEVFDLVSGVRRAGMIDANMYDMHTVEGTILLRKTGLCVDILDAMGNCTDHFELPKYIVPKAFVFVRGLLRPVVLATAAVQGCVLACWQPQPRFFRCFELFDTTEHGELVDACGIASRGMFVLTKHRSGSAYVHEAKWDKGLLRPGRSRRIDREAVMLVRDVSDKRAWLVCRGITEKPEITDLAAYFDRASG